MATKKSKKADKAFEGPLGQALGVVRTPVYAYIGANDLAIEAATGIVSDLRRRDRCRAAGEGRELPGPCGGGSGPRAGRSG